MVFREEIKSKTGKTLIRKNVIDKVKSTNFFKHYCRRQIEVDKAYTIY